MKSVQREIARITWEDSGLSFASTWIPSKDVKARAKKHDPTCEAVGYVVQEDERGLTMGLTYDREHDCWAACFWVAKKSILSRERIG